MGTLCKTFMRRFDPGPRLQTPGKAHTFPLFKIGNERQTRAFIT